MHSNNNKNHFIMIFTCMNKIKMYFFNSSKSITLQHTCKRFQHLQCYIFISTIYSIPECSLNRILYCRDRTILRHMLKQRMKCVICFVVMLLGQAIVRYTVLSFIFFKLQIELQFPSRSYRRDVASLSEKIRFELCQRSTVNIIIYRYTH